MTTSETKEKKERYLNQTQKKMEMKTEFSCWTYLKELNDWTKSLKKRSNGIKEKTGEEKGIRAVLLDNHLLFLRTGHEGRV